MEPVKAVLLQVMTANSDHAPGAKWQNFHMAPDSCTHAVSIARIKENGGYLVILNAEAAPMLSNDYAKSGKWPQSESVNIPGALLNAANGGAISWETMADRKPLGKGKAPVKTSGTTQIDITNVTLGLGDCFLLLNYLPSLRNRPKATTVTTHITEHYSEHL